MEEQELSRRCAAGDNAARELLYEQFSGRLFSICLRYMGDPPAAEDLLHDVFLKIFKKRMKMQKRIKRAKLRFKDILQRHQHLKKRNMVMCFQNVG